MYMRPLWFLSCFRPQLSRERERERLVSATEAGAVPRSIERLPMLWASSREPREPFEEGREEFRRIDLKPLEASRGDLGAVRGEKPEGGFAVRMTGALAARSSRDWVSSRRSSSEGLEKAP
jgi:hypothetical protein